MKRLVALAPLICTPAYASYNDGVKLFQTRNYQEALKQFGQAVQANPQDLNSHYYLGLCYQCINQHSRARKEFEYVAYYDRGQLQRQSQAAIQLLDKYGSQRSSSSSDAGSATQPKEKIKVYEFVTSWCSVCHKMEPDWRRASSKMSNVADFRQLDAENPSNKDLVDRFGINAYPTMVFTDNGGKVLATMRGGYSEDLIVGKVRQLTSK